MMRINADAFKSSAKELVIKANTLLRDDIEDALQKSFDSETGNAKKALGILIENAKIAKQKKYPLCQDTGYVSFFVEKGQNACIEGDITKVLCCAVEEAYNEMPFRQSIVADPFNRKPVKGNIPCFSYIEDSKNDKTTLKVIIKGAGSDNASALKMFLGSTTKEEISDWIVNLIRKNGVKTCPPMVIGIGIGGSFEKCALLSKKAFFRKTGERNNDEFYSSWETELLSSINKLGIGPSAFGGNPTALDVFIEQSPLHMASMPVAVNIGCWATRTATMEVGV